MYSNYAVYTRCDNPRNRLRRRSLRIYTMQVEYSRRLDTVDSPASKELQIPTKAPFSSQLFP
jgi:hypothetical protein